MARQRSDGPVRTAGGTLYPSSTAIGEHPVVAIHRGRRGSRKHPARLSLHDRDVDTVLIPGWLPETDDLPPEADRVKFIGLEKLRADQRRHLEQVRVAREAVAGLKRKFEEEDAAHHLALKAAFDEGKDLPADKRTATNKRESALASAQDSLDAAKAASISWAEGALDRARALAPDWTNAVAESHARSNFDIEQLQAQIAALRDEQRADQRLVVWLRRIDAPAPGSHIAFSSTGPGALAEDFQRPRFPGQVSIAPPGLPEEDTDQTIGAA